MASKELFIKRVYEIVNELKLPLIDERVYDRLNVNEKKYPCVTVFKFEEDESVLRGALGLVEYFHAVVFKVKDVFYFAQGDKLYKITN